MVKMGKSGENGENLKEKFQENWKRGKLRGIIQFTPPRQHNQNFQGPKETLSNKTQPKAYSTHVSSAKRTRGKKIRIKYFPTINLIYNIQRWQLLLKKRKWIEKFIYKKKWERKNLTKSSAICANMIFTS